MKSQEHCSFMHKSIMGEQSRLKKRGLGHLCQSLKNVSSSSKGVHYNTDPSEKARIEFFTSKHKLR